MTTGTLLYGALATDAGVAALVGTRIYPLLLPERPTLEALTYQRISNGPQKGSSTLRDSRWQISCWAERYEEAHELAGAVKTALEEYRDESETPGILFGTVVNELDDYDPDTDIFRTIVDVMLVTIGD